MTQPSDSRLPLWERYPFLHGLLSGCILLVLAVVIVWALTWFVHWLPWP